MDTVFVNYWLYQNLFQRLTWDQVQVLKKNQMIIFSNDISYKNEKCHKSSRFNLVLGMLTFVSWAWLFIRNVITRIPIYQFFGTHFHWLAFTSSQHMIFRTWARPQAHWALEVGRMTTWKITIFQNDGIVFTDGRSNRTWVVISWR